MVDHPKLIINTGLLADALLDPLVCGRSVLDPALVPAALLVVIELKAKECHPEKRKLALTGNKWK